MKKPKKKSTKRVAKKAAKKATKKVASTEPKPIEARILKAYPNPSWLMGAGSNGEALKVKAPLRMSPRLVGKTIKVMPSVDDSGETYYNYIP